MNAPLKFRRRVRLKPPTSVEPSDAGARSECPDLSEDRLRRILASYFEYHHTSRTHLSLDRNAPIEREVEPPSKGKVAGISPVGGLRRRYTRAA